LCCDGESQLGLVSLVSSFNLCPNFITHTNNGNFIDSVLKSVGVREPVNYNIDK
jgi:hypothetical protein